MKTLIKKIRFISPFHQLESEIVNSDVPVSAFELQWVSPKDIVRTTGRDWKPWDNKRLIVGDVRDGDWDITAPNPPKGSKFPHIYNDYYFHQSSVRHFKHGVDWEDTELYNRMVASKGDVKTSNELSKYDNLFESIRINGYKTQKELGNYMDNKRKQYVNEICVDRGRDGDYLFVDSRHRLSIAKILDLDKIPVAVLVRHADWVKKLEVK